MPNQTPRDEFDNVAPHGGRHRIRRTGADRVREWFLVLAATMVITGAGFYGFKFAGDANIFTSFSPTETGTETQVKSQAGPGVTVIDASDKKQQATRVATELAAAGYNVLTARNLDTLANPGSPTESVVYVRSADDASKAKEIAGKLGGLKVVTAKAFGDPITVVLGADFKK